MYWLDFVSPYLVKVFECSILKWQSRSTYLLEKAGRGGCIVCQNWSPNWDKTTLVEVRHQYEIVEIFVDYSDDTGAWVTPLTKLDGYIPDECTHEHYQVDPKKKDATVLPLGRCRHVYLKMNVPICLRVAAGVLTLVQLQKSFFKEKQSFTIMQTLVKQTRQS